MEQSTSQITESNKSIRFALDLIKLHIAEEKTPQNIELHLAVQILVCEFRKAGRLQ